MKRGFTLIELLVVIAIIAILAAILFPVFARAREKARQTSCLSNQKQIALGLLMYASDYDEALPGFYYKAVDDANWPLFMWVDAARPYVKNDDIFRCPSGGDYLKEHSSNYAGSTIRLSYHVNDRVCYGGRGTFDNRMSKITHPAETLLTFDAWHADRWCAHAFGHGSRDICYARPAGKIKRPEGSFTGDLSRHNGGANVTFCDGHGKWLGAGTWEWYPEHYDLYWRKSR